MSDFLGMMKNMDMLSGTGKAEGIARSKSGSEDNYSNKAEHGAKNGKSFRHMYSDTIKQQSSVDKDPGKKQAVSKSDSANTPNKARQATREKPEPVHQQTPASDAEKSTTTTRADTTEDSKPGKHLPHDGNPVNADESTSPESNIDATDFLNNEGVGVLTLSEKPAQILTPQASGQQVTGSVLPASGMTREPVMTGVDSRTTKDSNAGVAISLLTEKAVQADQAALKNINIGREQLMQPGVSSDKQAQALLARPDALNRSVFTSLPESTLVKDSAMAEMADGKSGSQTNARQFFQHLMAHKPTAAGALQSHTGAETRGLTNAFFSDLADTGSKVVTPESNPVLPVANHRSSPAGPGIPVPSFQLATTMGQSGWSENVGEKVMMMVRQDLRQAQLKLNPASLGPVEVKISMGQDQQVNVTFMTQNAAVREALDSAAMRLRDMLDSQGMNLSEFTVSQESFRDQQSYPGHDRKDAEKEAGFNAGPEAETENHTILTLPENSGDNLVDYFA